MGAGIAVGEAGSPITSDGLYLLAGMDASSKGEVVALEMDLERGGALEVEVIPCQTNAGYLFTYPCQ